jgi:hypothetical protein
MADIGHGGDSSVNDLHHNTLASIQVALSFIGVKVDETGRIDMQEKGTADNSAGFGENERVPEGGMDALIAAEPRVQPLKLSTSEG